MKIYYIIFLFILTILLPEELIPGNKEISLVLVYPKLTKVKLYSTDSTFNPTDEWELFLMSNHLRYRMVEDKNINEINDEDDVIIIPSLEVATQDIIENIEELLKEGKGVLITGDFAKYNSEGERTTEFQQRILNFRITPLSQINHVSINHTLKGNTEFSYGLNPGVKILLMNKPGLYYAEGILPKNDKTGYYLPPGNNFPDSLSGIVSEYKFSGRLLWLGFNFNQLIGNENEKFLSNSFAWLASQPEIFLNYLPDNYMSAGIIYKNIDRMSEFKFNDSSSILPEINYLIYPSVLEKLKDMSDTLTDSCNIVAVWDDFFFLEKSLSQKLEWLTDIKSKIGEITKQTYFGISTINGVKDSILIKHLKDADYSFIYSRGYSDSFAINHDSIGNIYYFINSFIPGLDEDEALKFIISNNGIFYLNADSLLSYENIKSYHPGIWITTFSNLLKWTINKEQIKTAVDLNNGEYRIKIYNNGSSDLENLGFWISLSEVGTLKLKNYDNMVKLTYDYDKKLYFLKVDLIKGYQNLEYELISEKF